MMKPRDPFAKPSAMPMQGGSSMGGGMDLSQIPEEALMELLQLLTSQGGGGLPPLDPEDESDESDEELM
jgi:hypothetical protein